MERAGSNGRLLLERIELDGPARRLERIYNMLLSREGGRPASFRCQDSFPYYIRKSQFYTLRAAS